MKSGILLCAVAGMVLAAGAANAQVSVSILGGGTSYPHLSYDGGSTSLKQGFNAGGRLGYELGGWMPLPGFSVAADIFYNQSNLKSGTRAQFDSLSYMGDLIYHFDTGIPLGIYGGAGAGAVRTEVDDPISARNSTVFGWQALAGADYPVMPGVSIFAEYRYQNAHDANLKFLGGPVGNTSNNASAGLKFEF